MIAITRDAAWAARLDDLSGKGGWSFAAIDTLPSSRGTSAEKTLVVLDRTLAGAAPGRTVAGLRALFPSAQILLACSDAELGVDGVAAGLDSGADEVVLKSWTDARLTARFAARRDAALAAAVRLSDDGTLKAELRSRRVFLLARSRWSELPVPAAEFALLWSLLGARGEPVSRERLLSELSAVSGREVEYETVSRRALSLRKSLGRWKG
ncbi:MAG: response regulator transcription factor, partial [Elusimicrobia bacterium]|nr:response regulator transcription factor [Elusimicrobiota bacterium]